MALRNAYDGLATETTLALVETVLEAVRDRLPAVLAANGKFKVDVDTSALATDVVLQAVRDRLPAALAANGKLKVDVDVSALATDVVLQAVRDRLPAALAANGKLKVDIDTSTLATTTAVNAIVTALQTQLPAALAANGKLKVDVDVSALATEATQLAISNKLPSALNANGKLNVETGLTGLAQDTSIGTDGTTPPPSGTGVRGYLGGIYAALAARLPGSLATSGSLKVAPDLQGLRWTAADGTTLNPVTAAAPLPVSVPSGSVLPVTQGTTTQKSANVSTVNNTTGVTAFWASLALSGGPFSWVTLLINSTSSVVNLGVTVQYSFDNTTWSTGYVRLPNGVITYASNLNVNSTVDGEWILLTQGASYVRFVGGGASTGTTVYAVLTSVVGGPAPAPTSITSMPAIGISSFPAGAVSYTSTSPLGVVASNSQAYALWVRQTGMDQGNYSVLTTSALPAGGSFTSGSISMTMNNYYRAATFGVLVNTDQPGTLYIEHTQVATSASPTASDWFPFASKAITPDSDGNATIIVRPALWGVTSNSNDGYRVRLVNGSTAQTRLRVLYRNFPFNVGTV